MNEFLMIYMVSGAIAAVYILLILYQSSMLFRNNRSDHVAIHDLGVTLIIPFKNECERIEPLLHNLNSLAGNEINFELLFVNDNSDDNTINIISKHIDIDYQIVLSTGVGKKEAIHDGVLKAKYDVILTLDADVRIGKKWLEKVRHFFSLSRHEFLIMPVLIDKVSGVAGNFESLDVLALTGATIAWAKADNPIMCNGANMGFRKNVFLKFRGHAEDLVLASGDDMFFMHQVKAKRKNSVGIMDDVTVVAHTKAFNDFKMLLNQRARWTSKSRFYKDRMTKIVSLIVLFNYVSILLLGLLCLQWTSLINLFLIVFISKVLIDFLFLVLLAVKFDKIISLWFYPLAALIQFIFIPAVIIKSQWGNFEWKGRIFKK